jgi:hypothetical protein
VKELSGKCHHVESQCKSSAPVNLMPAAVVVVVVVVVV